MKRRLAAGYGFGVLALLCACKGEVIGPPGDELLNPGAAGPELGPDGRYVCDDRVWAGASDARRLTPGEYAFAIRDLFGLEPSGQYPATYGSSVTGYSTEANINGISAQGVEHLLAAAEEVAEALAPALPELLPCAAAEEADLECAHEFLDTYGRRAFRRPLAEDERQGLVDLFSAERADGATFGEAVAVMTSALLQMPRFLYVLEGATEPGAERPLDGYELASQLSLLLWNSLPDDTLLDKAASGELASPESVYAEAARLFDDPRADRAFARFLREWTQSVRLDPTSKDPGSFPYLDGPFAQAVNDSFDLFASQQARSGNLRSLLRSSTVWVDDRLASFFGVEPPGEFVPLELDGGIYSGVMTQPGMMAALAHASEPSYVFRGRFVWKRLLCLDLGTPPGNAMSEFAALEKPADPTAKDLSSAVRSNNVCAGCHAAIDPPGLAFEQFDGMGAFRTEYPSGKPIDPSGTLITDRDAIEFGSPAELLEQLVALPEVRQCFAKQLFRFAASRAEAGGDLCAVQRIDDALLGTDNDLRTALLEATQTDAFFYRRGQ